MRRWRGALWGVWMLIDQRNLGLIAAGTGFFAMLAVFPGIAALIAIWGLAADPTIIQAQLDLMDRFVPAEGLRLIEVQLARLTAAQTRDARLGHGALDRAVALVGAGGRRLADPGAQRRLPGGSPRQHRAPATPPRSGSRSRSSG